MGLLPMSFDRLSHGLSAFISKPTSANTDVTPWILPIVKSGRMGAVTSPGTMNKKPKSLPRRMVNVLFTAALMLAGPALMMTSYQQVDADEELARTGVHAAGSITYFSDARKASNRNITVEYVAADGVTRYANAPVDHEQQPSVGEQVTVAYREQDPEQAVVLGYESNGGFLGGVGLILTAVFTTLGAALVVSGMVKRRRDKVGSSNLRSDAAKS